MPLVPVEFAGRSFCLSESDGRDQVTNAIRAGAYETPLPIMIMAMLDRTEGDFLDVGANTGVYTVLAALTRADCTVHAFEPYPPVLDTFMENVEANGIADRVQLHRVALSDQTGTATLYVPDGSHGLIETSASLRADWGHGNKTTLTVPQERLDDLSLPRLAVIKVDIEGHEPNFLEGAIETIMRDRPIIFAEVLDLADFDRLASFLAAVGYHDFRLRPDMAILTHKPTFDPSAWNHAFVPPQRMAAFRDACKTHAIEIVAPMFY